MFAAIAGWIRRFGRQPGAAGTGMPSPPAAGDVTPAPTGEQEHP